MNHCYTKKSICFRSYISAVHVSMDLYFFFYPGTMTHLAWIKMDLCNIKRKKGKSIEYPFWDSVSCSALYTHYLQCAHSSHGPDQFMGKQRIKFSPNDNPSLTSPEETNGAPRWCFNITNYLGVLGKGTDVALRMRKGWGAGQGHHTPRLGSDKRGWLEVFTCPQAIKRRRGQTLKSFGSSVIPPRAWGVGEGRGSGLSYACTVSLFFFFAPGCCWESC